MKKWAFAILVLALGGCAQTSPDVESEEGDFADVEEAQTNRVGSPIVAKTSELALLMKGHFDGTERFRWDDATTAMLRGGKNLSSPFKAAMPDGALLYTRVNSVGDTLGRPESFIKSLSGRIGHQSLWAHGDRVLAACAKIPVGTAIGTFFGQGGSYRGNVGFLASCAGGKIVLWDQSFAMPHDGLIRRHTLQNTAANDVADAAAYFVILAPE